MTIKGSGTPYKVAAARLYNVGAAPIPVPGGLVLLVTALGGLAGFSRLRRAVASGTPAAIA